MAPKAGSKPAPTAGAGGKRKFTPRPSAPVSERLPKLYRALTDQVNDGYFENSKKTCKKNPSSSSAFQTLLFLHLHTDDYAAALDLVTKPPAPSPPPLDFEKAYCLYRLHREKEAIVALEVIADRGPRERHLEAQIRYRLGEFEKAQMLYDEILQSIPPSSSEYDDIRTNQAATAAHISFIEREYTGHLSAQGTDTAGLKAYNVSPGELETFVPTIPSGWAPRGTTAEKATPSTSQVKETKRSKPRHRLPKGAVEGKASAQDPDRWLPLRQRASYVPAGGKKKKEQTGLGTQGATGGGAAATGGSHGGGGGKKKGKKK